MQSADSRSSGSKIIIAIYFAIFRMRVTVGKRGTPLGVSCGECLGDFKDKGEPSCDTVCCIDKGFPSPPRHLGVQEEKEGRRKGKGGGVR